MDTPFDTGTTITLTKEEASVLLTLLEFHCDDTPNEYYPYEPFKSLKEKMGLSEDNI